MFGKKKKKQDPFEGWREEDDHATDLRSDLPAGSEWGLMDDETKQRIVRDAGVQGLVVPNEYAQHMASGSFYDPQYVHLSTGTQPQWAMKIDGGLKADRISVDSLDVDALWEKMYQRMRKVIVICKYCQTPNVIDNQTCTQCGAPLPVEFL